MGIYEQEAKIKVFIIFLALATGFGIAVWDVYAPPPTSVSAVSLPDAPDFSFLAIGGPAQKLSDLRGKTVLINVWATWCAPCVVEMPDLLKFTKREDIVFIALSVDQYARDIRPFFDKLGVDYGHALIVHDQGKKISRELYGATMYPESFVISPEGKVLNKIEGVIDWLGPEGKAAIGR